MDNTPPDVSGSVTPDPLKSGDTLKIKAFSNIWDLYIPDDTASITATIFGKKYNMPKSDYHSGSMGEIEYIVPQLSDGVYTVFLTAEDLVGNSRTISVNYAVDNTPPIINAEINPNIVDSINFSSNRGFRIIAQSSPDTEVVYASYTGSNHFFNYSNGYWTLWVPLPPVMYTGTYIINLGAIDKAGNIGTTTAYFGVVDNTGIVFPPDQPGPDQPGPDQPGPDQPGPDQPGPDYTLLILVLLLIALLIILCFIFPIIGIIILDFLTLIAEFLLAGVPWFLELSFEFFFILTDMFSVGGVTLSAIAMALNIVTGNVIGIFISLLLMLFGFYIGSLGMCLIGLIVFIIIFWFTIADIMSGLYAWLHNKV